MPTLRLTISHVIRPRVGNCNIYLVSITTKQLTPNTHDMFLSKEEIITVINKMHERCKKNEEFRM